jgi:ATP-dependent Clp protease ATP-binding subunit ClpC
VFERFTEASRRVVVFAQEEARELRHNYIGTEHLLLGLLREVDDVTSAVFMRFGVTRAAVREQVIHIIGEGDEIAMGQIPFTPRAKKALDLALRHALEVGSSHIGPRHLFLGLLDEEDGVAAQILAESAPLEQIRVALGGTRLEPGAVARAMAVPASRSTVPLIVFGWLLFAVSLGIGVLIGWAIWS